MKLKFLSMVLFSVASIMLLVAAMSRSDSDKFLDNQAMITVRAIGHQLLLSAKDSTSRVLPVQQLSRGIFKLEFQNQFSFVPDTLVEIVTANLERAELPVHFLVNVFECQSNEIVYAFQIKNNKNNIVPCLGREQPKGCYSIQIAFVDMAKEERSFTQVMPYSIGLILISFIVYWQQNRFSKKSKLITDGNSDSILIGETQFILAERKIRYHSHETELSEKETRILTILAKHVNQLVPRDQLLKEVWEDEGVITGRSLDMFISRLRKKLKDDSCISITNVHGQGYRLEVANS